MTFPSSHLYLTIHWVPGGAPLETAQTGIRFGSAVPASQALVDACKTAVQTFWGSAGAAIDISYLLKFIRLAQVGTDGRYVPGTFAYDSSYGAGISGATSNIGYPLQTACVTTLLTGVPRGQAALGRIYLPPLTTPISSDYRWTAAAADARSGVVATMIQSLSSALQGPASVLSKGTKNSTVGASHPVEKVKTGRRPDVQRRRAKQLTELYGASVVARGGV